MGGGSVLATDPTGGKVALHAHRGRHTYTRVQLQAGDLIKCGKAGARVQPPGQGTGAFADGIGSSSDLQLTTNPDGSVVIDCSPGK